MLIVCIYEALARVPLLMHLRFILWWECPTFCVELAWGALSPAVFVALASLSLIITSFDLFSSHLSQIYPYSISLHIDFVIEGSAWKCGFKMYFLRIVFGLCLLFEPIVAKDYIISCGGLDINCKCNYERDTMSCVNIRALPDIEVNIPHTMLSYIRISGTTLRRYPTSYFELYEDLVFVKITRASYLDCSTVPERNQLSYRLSIPKCDGTYCRIYLHKVVN